MPGQEYWERRLEDKAAAKSLRGLYGRSDAARQAGRYARLATLAESDAASAAGADTAADAGVASAGAATRAALRFYSAPGRTELGGNHTDHNRGRVLCAAVRLDAVACVVPRDDLLVSLVSEGYPDPIRVDLRDLGPVAGERGRTESLVRGVARALSDKGIPLRGFAGRIHSEVMAGSGLSSSAAVEVLLGTVMADLAGVELDPIDVAVAGRFAENEYLGKPCGLMDQAASAVGGIVAIDFADPAAPEIRRLEFDFEESGLVLAVVDTGGSHADLTADYAAVPAEMRAVAAVLGAETLRDVDPAELVARGPDIRKACGDRALLRAFHFAAENARVEEMAEALERGEVKSYLRLVKKSGRSSWELLQNLYPPAAPREQGLPLALALSSMYIGGKGAWRVHGGGFAGTIQAYVPKDLMEGYAALMERYFGPACVRRVSVRPRGAARVGV
jgi:galactokinase